MGKIKFWGWAQHSHSQRHKGECADDDATTRRGMKGSIHYAHAKGLETRSCVAVAISLTSYKSLYVSIGTPHGPWVGEGRHQGHAKDAEVVGNERQHPPETPAVRANAGST